MAFKKMKKMSIHKFKMLIDLLYMKPGFAWEMHTAYVRLVNKENSYVYFGNNRQLYKLQEYLKKKSAEKDLLSKSTSDIIKFKASLPL